jgi:hypothetical protein
MYDQECVPFQQQEMSKLPFQQQEMSKLTQYQNTIKSVFMATCFSLPSVFCDQLGSIPLQHIPY